MWLQNESDESTFSCYRATKIRPDGATCVFLSTWGFDPWDLDIDLEHIFYLHFRFIHGIESRNNQSADDLRNQHRPAQ